VTGTDPGTALVAVLMLGVVGCVMLIKNRENRITATEGKLIEKDDKIMELLNKIEDIHDKQAEVVSRHLPRLEIMEDEYTKSSAALAEALKGLRDALDKQRVCPIGEGHK
jgi:Holliday junction resolvasome RuvABC endonuclease subunit